MCNFSGFDLILFFILQNFMKFMEMQHALVVSLIGFFRSWAIVLGQSCLWSLHATSVDKLLVVFKRN